MFLKPKAEQVFDMSMYQQQETVPLGHKEQGGSKSIRKKAEGSPGFDTD